MVTAKSVRQLSAGYTGRAVLVSFLSRRLHQRPGKARALSWEWLTVTACGMLTGGLSGLLTLKTASFQLLELRCAGMVRSRWRNDVGGWKLRGGF